MLLLPRPRIVRKVRSHWLHVYCCVAGTIKSFLSGLIFHHKLENFCPFNTETREGGYNVDFWNAHMDCGCYLTVALRDVITAAFNTPVDSASNLFTGDLECLAFNLDIGSEGETYLMQSMIAFLEYDAVYNQCVVYCVTLGKQRKSNCKKEKKKKAAHGVNTCQFKA